MKETPLLFGPGRNLTGVWCEPVGGVPPTLGLLLSNAGQAHRIGPRRINVKIARHMVAHGLPSLRFDLAGLGDSRVVGAAPGARKQAVGDIQAAMDQIERSHDIHRFAIFGIGAGAFNGYAAALADARLVGVSMMDGHAFGTWKTPWMHHLQRLHAATARELLAAAAWLPPMGQAQAPADALDTDPVVTATAHEFALALQTLVDRGVAVHLVNSGSRLDQYSYEGQFNDVFGRHAFAAKVVCEYLPELDHSVTLLAGQRLLLERLDLWVARLRRAAAGAAR